MRSPNPRNRDPVCDCGRPALSGYPRCVACQARVHADRGETSVAYAVGAYGGLTERQVDAVLLESSDYSARTTRQNAARRTL
jgi:hypothetical protein